MLEKSFFRAWARRAGATYAGSYRPEGWSVGASASGICDCFSLVLECRRSCDWPKLREAEKIHEKFNLEHHFFAVHIKMTRTSVLADALNAINNAEKTGKRQVMIRPSSKVIIRFLQVMQKHGYIGEFEYIDDHRSGKIVVQLNGRLNKCGVISPRFNVKIGDIERWTDNLLPARQFGYVILTTSAGIMDHEEARRKHVSGKILGFVY